MGKSLSVYKIKSELNSLEKKDEIILTSLQPKQQEMASFGAGSKLPQAITKLTFIEEKNNIRKYAVYQESKTILEPIKVFKWDYLEEAEATNFGETAIRTDKGYQKITNFKIAVDIAEKIIYVFSKKNDALILMHRLQKNEVVELKPYYLDLTKINLVPEIVDEWGVWLNDTGEFLKKAYFSTKVKKLVEGEEEFVTTYLVTYEHKDVHLDLAISREGRVSSNNRGITNKALVKIFNNLKEKIEKADFPDVD